MELILELMHLTGWVQEKKRWRKDRKQEGKIREGMENEYAILQKMYHN